ncbi:hypothetical protein E1B28_006954 [Marasmius oreades]|uniref:Uncharacterized protein n=1 Tax=Marasmius oreades TaxID=181124 RepID=A0A9P7UUF4_9AGAR|nr:uncharacterized protein E1B28_006954 [Marasmius oreades]KAG7093271.1 hypothetical protein E1B28_006954 [Marasmius oreades]
MSSPDQSPASAPPNLLNRLSKSLSGQNLTAKANQDSLGETQEVDVEENEKEMVATSPTGDGAGEETSANAAATNATPNDEGQLSEAAETHAVEPQDEKKREVTGFERLKNGLTKFSKGGHRRAGDSHSDHAVQASADTSAQVSIADVRVQDGEGGGNAAGKGADGEFSTDAADVAVEVEANGAETVVDAAHVAGGDDADKIPDDPIALADIIRNLVRSLPQPTDPVPVPSKPKVPQLDGSGKPIPPSGAVLTDNKQLVAKLRSPAVMNGKACDAPEGEEAPTVFAILDSFKAASSAPGNTGPSREGSNVSDGDDNAGEDDGGSEGEVEPHHTIADDWSVMVYLPLMPTKKSKVEMAKFEVVPINSEFKQTVKANTGVDDSKFVELLSTYRAFGTFGRGTVPPVIVEDGTSGGKNKETALRWPKPTWKLWPWKKKKTPTPAPAPSQPPTSAPDTDTKAPESGSGDTDNKPKEDDKPADGDKDKKHPNKLRKPKPTLDQRVWIPSNTQVSVQALWWGYRIFLPPPVMSILSDKSLEAAKRAAMITNALTWLFSHLPLTMFPAPMQPALLLLQHIVPFVGYIGTFITWSWSAIKSYDVGYGVILSATWILPVALIPGTWQAYDFPGSTNPPGTGATPSQPSIPNTPVTQPSTGTPTQPSAGTGQPTTNQPPTVGTPTQPSTGTGQSPATQPPAASTPTPTTGTIPELTMSTRLRMVKGNNTPSEPTIGTGTELTNSTRLKYVKGNIASATNANDLPPTVSKRLALVKGQVVPVLSTDPEEDVVGSSELPKTMSKRLALVKGKGEDVATGEKEGNLKKETTGGGVWKYLKGGLSTKESV